MSMRSKPIAALLADLDVAHSHSRPHVSDDNPLLAIAVPDLEVSTRLPGALRFARGCPDSLPALFPLVQQRASPQQHRSDDPLSARSRCRQTYSAPNQQLTIKIA